MPTENKTSLPSHFHKTNATKHGSNNYLNEVSSNVNSTQSTNAVNNNKHHARKNIPVKNSSRKKTSPNLRKRKYGRKEILNVNGTKMVTNVSSVSYSTAVIKDSNNATQFSIEGVEVGRNISELKNSQNKSINISESSSGILHQQSRDVLKKQGGKDNTAEQMPKTKSSKVDKAAGLLHANATNGLGSSDNNTSEMMGGTTSSQTKPNATARLDQKLKAMMLSEQNKMQNTSLINGKNNLAFILYGLI